MKSNISKNKFSNVSLATEKDAAKNNQKKAIPPPKAHKDMPAQLITPPSRVWNKIEAILDEQDKRRQNGDDIIAASFGITPAYKYEKVFVATTAFLSLASGLIIL